VLQGGPGPQLEDEIDEQVSINIASPDAHRLAKSKLAGEGQAIEGIVAETIKFVKQNSVVNGARDL